MSITVAAGGLRVAFLAADSEVDVRLARLGDDRFAVTCQREMREMTDER